MLQSLRIGEVARELGISIDTIRFYNRLGLFTCPRSDHNGYRLFTPEHVYELKCIRFLQELGLSLEEIKQLLVLRRTEKVVCPEVQKFLKSKIKEVKQKMVTLQRLEADLKRALRETVPKRASEDWGTSIVGMLPGSAERYS